MRSNEVQSTQRRFRLDREKEEVYWTHRFEQCGCLPPLLWHSLLSRVCHNCDVSASTSHTADGFTAYFSKTIDDIRGATADLPAPEVVSRTPSALSSFWPCMPAEVRCIVTTSLIKSCSLDLVPTFLVREFIDLLLPYITSMVSASLADGLLPDSPKYAVVSPLLNKPGLDVADIAKYHLLSNPTFMSNLTERAVASQLNEYLVANDLLPHYQSAYWKRHSTEMAALRVWWDRHTDSRQQTPGYLAWPS